MKFDLEDLEAHATVERMSFGEAQQLFQMAKSEGWNPGLHDLECAWSCDPDAFIALRYHGAMIAGGSIFKHDEDFGFMGLFIVLPPYRGLGLGRRLWFERLRCLRARLASGAVIGMDGVFDMEPFYISGGFAPCYETIRYQGVAEAKFPLKRNGERLIERTVRNEILLAYDRSQIPYNRSRLLEAWLQPDDHLKAAAFADGKIVGFGIARPAQTGHKIGPLVANSPEIAAELLTDLVDRLDGERVQIDVPTPNGAGVEIARSFGLIPEFGCRRMYFGKSDEGNISRIFGGMSLEFG